MKKIVPFTVIIIISIIVTTNFAIGQETAMVWIKTDLAGTTMTWDAFWEPASCDSLYISERSDTIMTKPPTIYQTISIVHTHDGLVYYVYFECRNDTLLGCKYQVDKIYKPVSGIISVNPPPPWKRTLTRKLFTDQTYIENLDSHVVGLINRLVREIDARYN